MSPRPYLRATSLVIPRPNANQLYSLGSSQAFSSTVGCIIPAPSISNHFSFPPTSAFASISTHGSTNGKYAGLILSSILSVSRTHLRTSDIVCLKCPIVISLPITTPSTCRNTTS